MERTIYLRPFIDARSPDDIESYEARLGPAREELAKVLKPEAKQEEIPALLLRQAS